MCHEIFWLLPCDHYRVIHNYCEDFLFELTPLGLPSPCTRPAKTRGELDNEHAFCTQPECQYQGRGWWCCNCKGRNVGLPQDVCQNPPPPVVFGNPPPDLSTESKCAHARCAECTSDPEHYRIMCSIRESIAALNIVGNDNADVDGDAYQEASTEGGANDGKKKKKRGKTLRRRKARKAKKGTTVGG